MANLTARDYLELVKLLRLDLYFMLALIGSGMPSVTINQLAQDKYCVNTYSVNQSVCLNLESAPIEYESVRNKVLEKATTLKMYTTIITTVPGVLSSLFLGYWIDTYPGHIRYILPIGPVAVVIQNLMIIYQCINFDTAPISLLFTYTVPALTSSLVMTGAFTYATRQTPAKYRAVRFTVMEVFVFAAIPVSTTLGGILLGMRPWFTGQLRNYIGVLIVSTVCSTIAAVWVLLTIGNTNNSKVNDDQEEKVQHHDSNPSPHDNVQTEKTFGKMVLDIFNFRNVLCTLQTAFKPRPNNQRAALLTTMISMVVCMIGYMGEPAIGLQYAQRVYHWTSEYYSYMGSTIIILPAIVVVLSPPLLLHKFNLHDTALGVLGSVSLSLAMLIRGIFLSAPAYFIAIIFGSFVGLLPIANRTIISRIIHNNEIGQIYALLSSIEPVGPLISSVLYTNIFNATIAQAPGTVYLVIGSIVLFPVGVMIWLYFTRNQWDQVLLKENVPENRPSDTGQHSKDDDDPKTEPLVRDTKSRASYRSDDEIVQID